MFLTYEEYIPLTQKAEKFYPFHQDVDRKPKNALEMAHIENELGVKSTCYFRYKPATSKFEIIKKIVDLVHEVGYHRENLSDTNVDNEKALVDFEKNLNEFRKITPIKIVSMQGGLLKKFNNRDLSCHAKRHEFLKIKNLPVSKVCFQIYPER